MSDIYNEYCSFEELVQSTIILGNLNERKEPEVSSLHTRTSGYPSSCERNAMQNEHIDS